MTMMMMMMMIQFTIGKLTSEKLQKKLNTVLETNETIIKQVSRFTHHTHHTHQVLPVIVQQRGQVVWLYQQVEFLL